MGGRYLIRKSVGAIVTIVLIVVLNFVLFRMMPGSPDRILLRNPNVSAEAIAAARERWGLDKPLFPDQLVSYLVATANGDLGYSFSSMANSVTDVLAGRLWPTLILFGLGELLAIIFGLALGAYTGWKRGGAVDYVGNGLSLVLYSTPYFVIGMILLVVFAVWLDWFPTCGMYHGRGDLQRLLRPVDRLPVASRPAGRDGCDRADRPVLDRDALVDRRNPGRGVRHDRPGQGHPRSATSCDRHAMPNAILPMVTLIAINLGYVIGGAITVEVVFNWPGLGTLTVDALTARDYPVLQGIFLILSVSVVVRQSQGRPGLCQFLDPRVRA